MRLRLPALMVVLALLGAACGGGDGDATSPPGDAVTDEGGGDPPAQEPSVDFEIFSVDEGAGCAVYVSVPESAVTGDMKSLIWRGVVTQEFTTCGFSDVVEVGLLTVNGLDNYNQPDFSQTVEHGYFAVDGWDDLVANCYSLELSDDCASQLDATFAD